MDPWEAFALGVGVTVCSGLVVAILGWLVQRWRRQQAVLSAVLTRFLGRDPNELTIVSRNYSSIDLPNVQLAIEASVRLAGGQARAIGYDSPHGGFFNDLRTLMSRGTQPCAAVGPVVYREVDVDVDRQLQCVENGLHLVELPHGKLVVHCRRVLLDNNAVQLEVLANPAELGTTFSEQIREQLQQVNVYRGRVLSLELGCQNAAGADGPVIRFHRLPPVQREEIVLPPETLDLLERNTVRFYRHAETLRRAGRSVRRGLLLHGCPGTGKTHTARWLAQSMEGVTVIFLTGDQLCQIKECCRVARLLAPSLVILEDVDLIATERNDQRHPIYQVTLHQLLNEMDGLVSEAPVIFLLTTNRAEVLEPALAARPGRIDQAIEYPLPDAACRQRLLELFGHGLHVVLKDPALVVAKTDGASPAFIQELVRKASLLAAEEESLHGGLLHVTDRHFEESLRELVLGCGQLTRNLLGFRASTLP
jgi:hypothetical protein